MDDFAVTYGYVMNALEIKKCSQKHPVSKANNSNTKKLVARCATK